MGKLDEITLSLEYAERHLRRVEENIRSHREQLARWEGEAVRASDEVCKLRVRQEALRIESGGERAEDREYRTDEWLKANS